MAFDASSSGNPHPPATQEHASSSPADFRTRATSHALYRRVRCLRGFTFFLVALVAFGGCQTRDLANPVAGQSGSAEADTLRLLHTDQREYRAGDRVELTLKNTTGKVVGTNLCFVYLTLERAVQGEWAPVSGPLAPPYDRVLQPAGPRVSWEESEG